MNNKRLGTAFEKECLELLKVYGWWAHFISPNERGAQPFDIIAVKNGQALVFDCKTSNKKMFNINRLEENQKFAFQKWIEAGNSMPIILVKFKNEIYRVDYDLLKQKETINLKDCTPFELTLEMINEAFNEN